MKGLERRAWGHTLAPSKTLAALAISCVSTPSRQFMFTAIMGVPSGAGELAKHSMPQTVQNLWWIACLLKRYSVSGPVVVRLKAVSGTKAMAQPNRRQRKQLHITGADRSASTVNW